MPRRLLLASIHDVGPRFESETDALFERIVSHIGSPRLAMLVVPDHWGMAPLSAARNFQTRLRSWADQGVEMFVHGWFHKDMAAHSGASQLKAKYMTAGEGEFLGLDHATALQRMTDGKALIEDIIGRPATGFIAPAWLYGDGARSALSEAGFGLVEDHFRVWRPATGEVLTRGPVITWATRTPARQASSLFFAAAARTLLQPSKVVRVAVHPGDTGSQPVLESIDRCLKSFTKERHAAAYADLK